MKKLARLAALCLAAAAWACGETPTAQREPQKPRHSTTVRVTMRCPSAMWVGEANFCTAAGYDSAGYLTTGNASYWGSSNPSSLSVDGNGNLYAWEPYGATITAVVDGISVSAGITVNYTPYVTYVVVSPNPATVYKGYTRQMTAKAFDQYGWEMGATFTWTSSNTSVAPVSSSGVVSGANVGSATVSATASGVTGSATVNVSLPPLTVSLSGPQYVARYTSSQYTATASGGTGPYTYQWHSRQGNGSYWGAWSNWYSTGSTNYTYASISACGLDRDQLEVKVTDAVGATATTSYTFYITNP
ncbi:MAG TPA: Ig-like domain-containing protein, partial [Longimicrobiaceae bacterium]